MSDLWEWWGDGMNAQSSASDPVPSRQQLSALIDGELAREDVARLCQDWRDDAELQEAWHAWSVVGDVMRSQELAAAVPRDRPLLAAIQARLAQEPVVLAPQAAPGLSHRLGWRMPAAMAAGCAMVVGALWVSSQPADLPEVWQALRGPSAQDVVRAAASASSADGWKTADYVQAHRQYAHVPGLATPDGFQPVVATTGTSR
jgi:sigma-E factor negative regulatory protein RseA